jgi:type I restriction enzyme S subunit
MKLWESKPLRALTRKIGSGATPRGGSTVYQDTGVSFIRSKNVLDSRMRLDDLAHLSDAAAAGLAGVSVQPNDVLINITGESVARCCVVDPAVLPARVSQHVAILRASDELAPRYLQAMLVSPSVKAELNGMSSGGTRRALTKAMLANLAISVPPFERQRDIAELLGALDDKIAANAELARTADDLSGAYYSQMLGDANDRPLSSIASFTNGRAFTKGASGTGRVVVRIAELNSGIGPSTVRSNAAVADQYTARAGDILFAWSGSLTVNRWYRPEAIVNQHIFKVEPVDGFPRWLVFRALRAKLSEFRNIAADKATTMGHIQRYHLDDAVSLPDRPEIGARDALMTALWNRALAAEKESLALTELRDTLLPHLMSGRLKVQDAEKTVSDAV